MNRSVHYFLVAASLSLLAASMTACDGASTQEADHHDHSGEHEEEHSETGLHGGRLLEDGDFALEVTIFETGAEPQLRIYPMLAGEPIGPSEVDAQISLSRLGGKTDKFAFAPEGDYLKGNGIVREPHSFDVTVRASHEGKAYAWSYESHEGRTVINDAAAAEAGVVVEAAGPAKIHETIELFGTVSLAPSAMADVRAVYPGRVVKVTRTVGDSVNKGDTLAQIESSSSLQVYSVRAPISGTILERHTNEGDVAASEPLFVIGDISAAEAQFHVFPKDAAQIKPGQTVRMRLSGGDIATDSKIDSFLPFAQQGTQSIIARLILPRESGFRPGMRIFGAVEVASTDVALAVRESALQSFRDFTVVFAKHGESYEVRMLELGRRDGEYAEVLSGIDPGELYVTANSFLIKADIEKSGASHDH